jgi:hypothetical protein
MHEYTKLFLKNGFDDLTYLLDGMKGETCVRDENLREIGIDKLGHRAKILLKLEEESRLLDYPLPNSAYYNYKGQFNNKEELNDNHLRHLVSWFANLKLEKYAKEFILNGYHSMELLYCQMSSRLVINNLVTLLMREVWKK